MTFVEALIGLLLCIVVGLLITAVVAVAIYNLVRQTLLLRERRKEKNGS